MRIAAAAGDASTFGQVNTEVRSTFHGSPEDEMKRTWEEEKPLERYNAMRRFGTTEEPRGELQRTQGKTSYVIQKHSATALHYDFRLELDGVLVSWAIPKGPSLSPKQRRLAVQTEDHTVDYRDFEGTIPEGEYGSGAVIVWDRGTWEPIGDPRDGLNKGKLEFVVQGEKLQGKFRLVKLAAKDGDRAKKNWLLMKGSDRYVRNGEDGEIVKRLPGSVITGRTIEELKSGTPAKVFARKKATTTPRPSASKRSALGPFEVNLATLVEEVPTQGDWVNELK